MAARGRLGGRVILHEARSAVSRSKVAAGSRLGGRRPPRPPIAAPTAPTARCADGASGAGVGDVVGVGDDDQ